MMSLPTAFELDLVRAVLEDRKGQYPLLWAQIPFLQVRSRELTGVGGYVNFDLAAEGQPLTEKNCGDDMLGASKNVDMNNLESGLGFVLCISGGRISFLELFTYGDEEWDGKIEQYKIVNV